MCSTGSLGGPQRPSGWERKISPHRYSFAGPSGPKRVAVLNELSGSHKVPVV